MQYYDEPIKGLDKFPNIPAIAGIYCITCNLTGRKYVGSSKNIKRRFKQHSRKGNRSGYAKYFDINKYSFEVVEVLKKASQVTLFTRELYWILEYKSYEPHGFNQRNPTDFICKYPRPIKVKEVPIMGNKGKCNNKVVAATPNGTKPSNKKVLIKSVKVKSITKKRHSPKTKATKPISYDIWDNCKYGKNRLPFKNVLRPS